MQNHSVDLTEYPLTLGHIACSIALISSQLIFWERKLRIIYLRLIHWCYMNESEKKKNLQHLSQSKIPCSDLYGNWLKKIPWAEVDIIFENSFDTNSKIQLYNKKGK